MKNNLRINFFLFLSIVLFASFFLTTKQTFAGDTDCQTISGTCKTTCASTESEGSASCGDSANKCCVTIGLPTNTDGVFGILSNILNFLLSLVGILSLLGFVLAGFQYFFMAFNEKLVENAKKTLTASIIGLIIVLSGLIIIYAISKTIFGISL
jgi:hypothetical protein